MERTYELDVEKVKLAILAYASEHNVSSDVLLAALADIVGMTAATLDQHVGPLPLSERLVVFIERAQAAHCHNALGRAMLARSTAQQRP